MIADPYFCVNNRDGYIYMTHKRRSALQGIKVVFICIKCSVMFYDTAMQCDIIQHCNKVINITIAGKKDTRKLKRKKTRL